MLTHWGRVTHICVGNLIIIGSDNGMSPGRRQAIIWTNAGILLIGPLGTNFNEIVIAIQTFSVKKMHLKILSVKWRAFCLGLNVLTILVIRLEFSGRTWSVLIAVDELAMPCIHYNDVIMGAIASQITSLTIVYSTVYSDADERKHQSSASLAFVWGIHRWPVNSPHKWPVMRKMVPFDDIMSAGHQQPWYWLCRLNWSCFPQERILTADQSQVSRNDRKCKYIYYKISNIRHTKSQNLNDSHLVL